MSHSGAERLVLRDGSHKDCENRVKEAADSAGENHLETVIHVVSARLVLRTYIIKAHVFPPCYMSHSAIMEKTWRDHAWQEARGEVFLPLSGENHLY